MKIVGEVTYNGFRFKECSCSCGGGSFFAAAEDVDAGIVHSCGHQFAGRDIKRLWERRYPPPQPRIPLFTQLLLPFG